MDNNSYLLYTALVGISVERVTPRFSPITGTNHEIEPRVIHAIGFRDVDEYVDAYPGNYMTDSATSLAKGTWDASNPQKIVNITISDTIHNERGVLKEIASRIYQYANRTQNGIDFMLLLQPTIYEMHRVSGCKTIKEKDLWFCSDWKG